MCLFISLAIKIIFSVLNEMSLLQRLRREAIYLSSPPLHIIAIHSWYQNVKNEKKQYSHLFKLVSMQFD